MSNVPSSVPTFNTRSTVSGALQRLTQRQIRPFAKFLEIVPDDAKPFADGMFKPGEVGEHANPEPVSTEIEQAQAAYDEVLKTNAPNSNVARQAKTLLDAVLEAEAIKQAEAAQANAALQDGGPIPAPSGSEGE